MVMETTIKALLKESIQYLKSNGVENNTILDAQLILSHILNVDRLYLTVHGDETLNEEIINQYRQLIKLRATGMPLQYIVGRQEFMSLPFKVTTDVLIPRGDTEILVECIIKEYRKAKKHNQVSIMDIGTGSGCIAVSLAYYISNSTVWAVDVSAKALKIAQYNAELNGVNRYISFVQHDILKSFPEVIAENSLDVIVSNPPYISTEVIGQLQKEVKDYEPQLALDGGADGLIFYRKIVDEAHPYLKSHGMLAFEVGHDQSDDVAELIESNGHYANIEVVKDLAGINRVVIARNK
ncbi:MAG: release factor glutamine methyltransferase [Clostridiales bacterium]|jgi:release factor glutamine methyltransferase|nr:release factor glutamine methyltransferase [Clostridiales bacterium]